MRVNKKQAAAGGRRAVQSWQIARLKDHPEQARMFGDLPEAELAALAASLAKHGLRDPVEVLPDGTVLCGHQRVRAARRLGWQTIAVTVRADLANNPAAAEELFLGDNLDRRQLSPLGRAKCIQRLAELAAKSTNLWGKRKEDLKATVATRLGLSLRSVNRYLLVLQAPAAVQQAFDLGQLTLVTAGKVALLGKSAQAEVARRLAAGEPAGRVVAAFLRGTEGRGQTADASYCRLIRALRREVPQVAGHLDEVAAGRFARCRPCLEEAAALLAAILGRPEAQATPPPAPTLADVLAQPRPAKARKGR